MTPPRTALKRGLTGHGNRLTAAVRQRRSVRLPWDHSAAAPDAANTCEGLAGARVLSAVQASPPGNVTERLLADSLIRNWSVDVADLTYVSRGFGSYHWAVETGAGRRYFLTVDDLDGKPWLGTNREVTYAGLQAAYDTAVDLRDQCELEFVVAPLQAHDGDNVHRLTARYSLVLFPFIDGQPGEWGDHLGSAEVDELVRILARLHLSTPRVPRRPPTRGLPPAGRAVLEQALGELTDSWSGGPFSEPARRELADHATAVQMWLGAIDGVAAHAETGTGDLVITHGEPHPGNLIRTHGRLLLIDWDTVAWARPDRDLWMIPGLATAHADHYRALSGREVDDTTLSLYRLAWAIADLAVFVNVFRSPHVRNVDTEKSWNGFRRTLRGSTTPPFGSAGH